MQVPTVNVERCRLVGHCVRDAAVGVTNTRNVVICIQVTSPSIVEQPDTVAADDVNGLTVEQRRAGTE